MKRLHLKVGQTIAQAWSQKDINALREVLSEDINWYEGPYEQPLTTRSAICKQWENDLAQQTDIKIVMELLDVVDSTGYHHCSATWREGRAMTCEVDGLFIIKLDKSGKIAYFMPYYAEKDNPKW